jgi:hypothetical protein
MIPASAVRTNEFARDKGVARLGAARTRFLRIVFSEMCDYLVALIQKCDACIQIRNYQDAFPFVEMARCAYAVDKTDVFTVEGEILNAFIRAVRYGEDWFRATRIHR